MAEAFATRNNFWSKLRVGAGFKIKDIADYLKVDKSTVYKYFTGEIVPNEENQRLLCALFSVDTLKGQQEFEKAHKEWDVMRTRTAVVRQECDPEPAKEKTETSDIFELVYNSHALSYSDFNKFFDAVAENSKEALRLVYGNVDFDTYNKIEEIIVGKS